MAKKKQIFIGVGVAVLAAVIIGGSVAKSRKKGAPVDLHEVKKEDVVSRVSASGKVEAKRKVDVSAHVMGQIVNLAVREGDRVRKGQFLLQIDRTQLRAQTTGSEAALAALLADREAAKANALQARADFVRAEKNFKEKIVSEAEYQRFRAGRDAAEANLASSERRIEQARASLEASRDNLSKTTLRATMDGLVTALPVEEGEIAVIGTMNNAGTKLMTISDMSVVEADLEVDETDIPRVALGQKATMTIDAFPDQSFEGIVSEIGSSPVAKLGSQEAVEFSVKVVLKSPPKDLRPGFSVTAEIETGERKGVIAIPVQALVVQDMATKIEKKEKQAKEKEDELSQEMKKEKKEKRKEDVQGVFKVEAGKAKFIPLKTGLQGELLVEILEGLKEKDSIVLGPYRTLRTLKEGDPIRPQTDKEKNKRTSGEKS